MGSLVLVGGDRSLAERCALITGGSSGIGLALSQVAKSRGVDVTTGGKKYLDVSDGGAWWNLSKSLGDPSDRFDYVFLNAGIGVIDFDGEFKKRGLIIGSNLMGVYYGLYMLPTILKIGGVAVVTASVCAHKPNTLMPLYAATKAAAVSLVKSFGVRYAGKYRVFSVSPGFVYPTNFGGGPGEVPRELIDRVPLKRVASPKELAEFVWSLVDHGSYLCGDDIIYAGGWQHVSE